MGNKKTIQLTLESNGVLEICLNRPDVRNAFNEIMISELTEVFQNDVLAPNIRLVVLKGDGSVFCAGGDLNWMKKSVEMSYEENFDDALRLTNLFLIMNECPKPLIGAVHGAAIGGGVGLISVCDRVIATQETQFSLSEVRLGIVPACIGPFVISKIGPSHARNLFISAERFTTHKAMQIGLIHEVVENFNALQHKLNDSIEQMLQCGPQAMAAAKKLVLDLSWPEKRAQMIDHLEYVAKMLADLRTSPEGQEGLQAFLEKRKPHWILKN